MVVKYNSKTAILQESGIFKDILLLNDNKNNYANNFVRLF